MGSQGLKRQSQNLMGLCLGPLSICYTCYLAVFLEFLTVGEGVVSQSSACFWDPFCPTGLPGPVLSWRFVCNLIPSCYALFGFYPWEAWDFLKVKGEGLGMWELGRTGRSGGSGNCAWFILYKRILNFLKNRQKLSFSHQKIPSTSPSNILTLNQ